MTQTRRHSSAIATLASLIAGAVLALSPAIASATTIHAPPWMDIFGGDWSDINTTTAATNFYNETDTGYHRFLSNSPTAALAMGPSYAQSDAMWATFGHGGPGFITFCSPPNGSSCTSVLRATSALGSCSSPHACLSNYSTTIRRLKLMAFVGCETALSASGVNLLTTAVTTDGVDTAIGWDRLLYVGLPSNAMEFYGQEFAKDMRLGQTASDANLNAIQVIRNNNFGFAYGFDGYVWRGNPYIVTSPPAYGS